MHLGVTDSDGNITWHAPDDNGSLTPPVHIKAGTQCYFAVESHPPRLVGPETIGQDVTVDQLSAGT